MLNQNMGKGINNLILELHVPSFQPVRDFYAIFGFNEFRCEPTPMDNDVMGYLVLKRKDEIGETVLNFYGDKEKVSQHSYFKDFPSDTPRGYAVEVVIFVSNIEKLWDDVKDKLAKEQIISPLKLRKWNNLNSAKQDFRVVDPFGFYICFSQFFE